MSGYQISFGFVSQAWTRLSRQERQQWVQVGRAQRLSGINAFQKYNYDWWLFFATIVTVPPVQGKCQQIYSVRDIESMQIGTVLVIDGYLETSDDSVPVNAVVSFGVPTYGKTSVAYAVLNNTGSFELGIYAPIPDTYHGTMWIRALQKGYYQSVVDKGTF